MPRPSPHNRLRRDNEWQIGCGVPGCPNVALYLVRYSWQVRNGALAMCARDTWQVGTWVAHRGMELRVDVHPLF